MCRRNVRLDEVKQTPVESRESPGPLMCDELTPVSTSDYCSVNWQACSWPGDIGLWPWNIHWCQPRHADTCTANSIKMFRSEQAFRWLRQIRRSVRPSTFYSRWWSVWCYRGWTTETLCWSAGLLTILVKSTAIFNTNIRPKNIANTNTNNSVKKMLQ